MLLNGFLLMPKHCILSKIVITKTSVTWQKRQWNRSGKVSLRSLNSPWIFFFPNCGHPVGGMQTLWSHMAGDALLFGDWCLLQIVVVDKVMPAMAWLSADHKVCFPFISFIHYILSQYKWSVSSQYCLFRFVNVFSFLRAKAATAFSAS